MDNAKEKGKPENALLILPEIKPKNRIYLLLTVALVLLLGGFAIDRFSATYTSKFPLVFKNQFPDQKYPDAVNLTCTSAGNYLDATTKDTMACTGTFVNPSPYTLEISNITIEHGLYADWTTKNTRHTTKTNCNEGKLTAGPNERKECTFTFSFEDIGLNGADVSFFPGLKGNEGQAINAFYMRIKNPVDVITPEALEERNNTRLNSILIGIAAIIYSILSAVKNVKSIIEE